MPSFPKLLADAIRAELATLPRDASPVTLMTIHVILQGVAKRIEDINPAEALERRPPVERKATTTVPRENATMRSTSLAPHAWDPFPSGQVFLMTKAAATIIAEHANAGTVPIGPFRMRQCDWMSIPTIRRFITTTQNFIRVCVGDGVVGCINHPVEFTD